MTETDRHLPPRSGRGAGSTCSDSDPQMLETGSAYLRIVGPAYGFFGLGLSLYFASQGAGRLFWPLIAGIARLADLDRRRLAGAAPDGIADVAVRRR